MDKKRSRLRRALKARSKMRELMMHRLSVHRTSNHIYAQIVAPNGDKVIAAASTLDKDLSSKVKHGGNIAAAGLVGELIAQRAKKAGITKVAFDRSGYKYHGRVAALADAARKGGIEF